MRRIPSFLALLVASVTIAAGCSSDPHPVEVGRGGEADDTSAGTPDDDGTGSDTSISTTVPGTAPDTGELWLDPAGALLAERDVADRWNRPTSGASEGYDVGPNQTDCETYWSLESLVESSMVSLHWFQPDANLTHDVYDAGHDAAGRIEAAAVDVIEDCPYVTWLEGGNLSISGFDLGRSDAVATEVVSDVGEIWWTAYAVRANLLSRLQRVHFEPGTQPSAAAHREFLDLVGTMIDRLHAAPARPGIDELPDVGTTTLPPILLPPTDPTVPPVTLPPMSTTTTLDPGRIDDHPMAYALLAEADLEQINLRIDQTTEAMPSDPDEQRISGCAASESIVDLDGWFTLQRSYLGSDGVEWLHLVGRAGSAAEAEATIAEFGAVGDCVPGPDSDLAGATLSGDVIDGIVGGSATLLKIDLAGFTANLVAYQVSDIVGVVAASGSAESDESSFDLLQTLTQVAIDRASRG